MGKFSPVLLGFGRMEKDAPIRRAECPAAGTAQTARIPAKESQRALKGGGFGRRAVSSQKKGETFLWGNPASP